MSDAESWVQVVRVVDRLRGRVATSLDDARVAVERATENVMVGPGPVEVFSRELPVYVSAPGEEELAPIDILYGRYIPGELRIEIFVNRIHQDAPRFNVDLEDFLRIVRIHEYAHAAVHTGIYLGDVAERLEKLGPIGVTDWDSFRAERDKSFKDLDGESHELLAQAITWASLVPELAGQRSQQLMEAFRRLESRQPKRYQLSPGVREAAPEADWRLVLKATRDDLGGVPNLSFRHADGLAELISATARAADEGR